MRSNNICVLARWYNTWKFRSHFQKESSRALNTFADTPIVEEVAAAYRKLDYSNS